MARCRAGLTRRSTLSRTPLRSVASSFMATDPGDLVLDPTCGSGTTAYVAEQWGRRWITIDTSRVALALARSRIMARGTRTICSRTAFEGRMREAAVTRAEPSAAPTYGDIRHGFVYERVPHIQLRDIANNAEIDVIWGAVPRHPRTAGGRQLNTAVGEAWEEWEIPREAEDAWPAETRALHEQWWEQRQARQREIDASIAAKADFEYLYDKPYQDNRKVRVAGPFHGREPLAAPRPRRRRGRRAHRRCRRDAGHIRGAAGLRLHDPRPSEHRRRAAGAQGRPHRVLLGRPMARAMMICAEGRFADGGASSNGTGAEKRAGIFVGPEFGTVSRPDLVEAAREAADAGFDVLIACAFNYEAHATEFNKLGRVPVLKARMNADLHMASDLKNTGKGNLFVIFGEPDIDILDASGDGDAEARAGQGEGQRRRRVPPQHRRGAQRRPGRHRLLVHRHRLQPGELLLSVTPTSSARTTRTRRSRPRSRPRSTKRRGRRCTATPRAPSTSRSPGRIAVKVINHLGDEVMKVFRVD